MSTQIKDKTALMEYREYEVLKFTLPDPEDAKKTIPGEIHENGANFPAGSKLITTRKRAAELDPEGKKLKDVTK